MKTPRIMGGHSQKVLLGAGVGAGPFALSNHSFDSAVTRLPGTSGRNNADIFDAAEKTLSTARSVCVVDFSCGLPAIAKPQL